MELVFPLSPADLSRWSRFGLKGGIGRAEALVDKLAEDPGELMFLKGDQVVVLFEQEGCFLVRRLSGCTQTLKVMLTSLSCCRATAKASSATSSPPKSSSRPA